MWHSLKENGDINFYDVRWSGGAIETDIPAILLEKLKDSDDLGESHKAHPTEGYEEGSAISERKYKKNKKNKKKKTSKRNLKKLYPYFYGYGDHDNYYEPGIEGGIEAGFDGGGE